MRWLTLFLVLISCQLSAQFISISNGDWDDTLTWLSGSVPSSTDTVIVQHFITFSRDLTFDSTAHVTIVSGKILCGPHHVDIWCGAAIIVDGQLKTKSTYIEGKLEINGFYQYLEITTLTGACSDFTINGQGHGHGGGTFDCLDTSQTLPVDTTEPPPPIPPLPPEPEKPKAFVPNIFSPNGDGTNDMLFVRGADIKSITVTIYDRWGSKLFETTDMSIGWDGTYIGQPCNNGVYIYRGTVTYADESIEFIKGNITLVR